VGEASPREPKGKVLVATMKRNPVLEIEKENGLVDAEPSPTNFLLKCSDRSLGNFELARLAEVANLRAELQGLLDRMLEQMSQAAVAAWFRQQDRQTLKRAIEQGDDVVAWAKAEIRRRSGQAEKQGPLPSPSLFRPSLPPGKAHLAAVIHYQERNIAAGKCYCCPKPLDRNSVRMCTDHLRKERERKREKKKAQAGKSIEGERG
jgi:hypothetical protein